MWEQQATDAWAAAAAVAFQESKENKTNDDGSVVNDGAQQKYRI